MNLGHFSFDIFAHAFSTRPIYTMHNNTHTLKKSSILAKIVIAIHEIIQIIIPSSDKGAKNILKSHHLTFGYATNVL